MEFSSLAKLLGEDNEKKLKDAITDLLIERFSDDLDLDDHYIIDFDKLFTEIEEDVVASIKERVTEAYVKKMEERLKDLL